MATGTDPERVRRDYGLRFSDPEELHGELHACRFIRIASEAAAEGDVLVVRPGPVGLHLVMLVGDGYIHADLRLRRVVEVPDAVPWPVLSAWRDPAVAVEDPSAPELISPGEALS